MLICLPISNKAKGTKGNESAREMENVFVGKLYRLELYVYKTDQLNQRNKTKSISVSLFWMSTYTVNVITDTYFRVM